MLNAPAHVQVRKGSSRPAGTEPEPRAAACHVSPKPLGV